MTEVAGVAAKPLAQGGEATRLIALLERGEFAEADSLTTKLAAETVTWIDAPGAAHTAAQRAEKVRQWWVGTYQRILDKEDAEDAELLWVAAATRKKEALAEKAERAKAAEPKEAAEGRFANALGAAIADDPLFSAEAQPRVDKGLGAGAGVRSIRGLREPPEPKALTYRELTAAMVAGDAQRAEAEAQRAEEEPKAEGDAAEPKRKPITVSFSLDDPIEDTEAAVLSPAASYDNAREFARRRCWKAGSLAVYAWGGKFWEWNERTYHVLGDAEMKSWIYSFLDGSVKMEGKDYQRVRFRPKPQHVNDLLDGLRAGLALPGWCDPPMRLDTGERAGAVMMFRNGLLDVATGARAELTPNLWIHDEVGYEWNPDAKCPGWLAFLEGIFPGDQEAKDCVEELLGLSMTEDVSFQKGALLIGKPRSGKGTILGVGEGLIGTKSFVSLDLEKWTMGENSGERLIGKKMLAFADVRLKPPKWFGQNFDPGGVDYKSAGWLLKITGGDPMSLGRKWNAVAWEGQLPGKVWMVSNKVPNFNDAVLPTRFVKLAFEVSYLGREDNQLLARLRESELPGIAARCLRAYRRAQERGRLIQPRSAGRLEREIVQGSDPFTQFVQETFVADPEGSVTVTRAFTELELWCAKHGRPELLKSITNNNLKTYLRGLPGFEKIETFRPHGEPRRYKPMRLRKQSEKGEDD